MSTKFWYFWDHSCNRLFNSFDLDLDDNILVPNHHEPDSLTESQASIRCPWGLVSVVFTSSGLSEILDWSHCRAGDLDDHSSEPDSRCCKLDELQFGVMLEDLVQMRLILWFHRSGLFIRLQENPMGQRHIGCVLRSPAGTVELPLRSVLPKLSITLRSVL